MPEGNNDEKSELSMELSLFSKKKTTNESSSSFSERNVKKPIFYNFLGLQQNDDQADQVGEADEGLGQITKSQHESEEISLELKVGCASYTTKKRKANENLLACRIERMKLSCREVRREEMRSGVSLELKLGVDPWVIKIEDDRDKRSRAFVEALVGSGWGEEAYLTQMGCKSQ
jgi:hypothetical protein